MIRRAYEAFEDRVVLDYTFQGERLTVSVTQPNKAWDAKWLIRTVHFDGHVTSAQYYGSVEEMMKYGSF